MGHFMVTAENSDRFGEALDRHSAELYCLIKQMLYEVEGFERRTGVKQFSSWLKSAKEVVAEIEGGQ